MTSLKLTAASYRLAGRLDPEKLVHLVDSMNIKRSTILDYVYPNNVKIAAVHMKLTSYRDVRSFAQECCGHIDTAVKAGAHVVLFPHLLGLALLSAEKSAQELVSRYCEDLIGNKAPEAVLQARFGQLSERFCDFLFDCYYNLFLLLARRYNVYLAAGSTYVNTTHGVRCRSFLFSPDHADAFFQDKIHLSREEKRAGVKAGDELNVLDLKVGRVALLAGEDAVFFECYKVAQSLGAQIVLSPALLAERLAYTPRYNASLLAAQHYSLFTARSSFFSGGAEGEPDYPGASGVYAPLAMTRNLDGVVVHTNDTAAESHVLCARIDPPKLIDNIDSYAYSTNAGFADAMMAEAYPPFFRARENAAREESRRASAKK